MLLRPLTTLYKNKAFEKFYWSVAHPYYYSPRSISKLIEKLDIKIKYKYIKTRDTIYQIIYLALKGKPGGQNFYEFLSKKTINSYKNDLIKNNYFDTMFIVISK